MIGTYNVARWIQHVANYNFYIDPRWDWVAETLLYAAAFLTCGGVSMATGMPQVARQVMAGHEAEASSVASCI
jgi:hypothetical protein